MQSLIGRLGVLLIFFGLKGRLMIIFDLNNDLQSNASARLFKNQEIPSTEPCDCEII